MQDGQAAPELDSEIKADLKTTFKGFQAKSALRSMEDIDKANAV